MSTVITEAYCMSKTKSYLARWVLDLLEIIDGLEKFHPRAMKLMKKRKNFVVVANDEPYFLYVYGFIRNFERTSGTWTEADEERYQEHFN